MAKLYKNMSDPEKAAFKWEDDNLIEGIGYFLPKDKSAVSVRVNMTRRGYDAFRVSPQVTTKFGKKYRKIFGGTVNLKYINKRPFPKVEWHEHGFIKDGRAKPGTTLIETLKDLQNTYDNVSISDLKSQFMLK